MSESDEKLLGRMLEGDDEAFTLDERAGANFSSHSWVVFENSETGLKEGRSAVAGVAA